MCPDKVLNNRERLGSCHRLEEIKEAGQMQNGVLAKKTNISGTVGKIRMRPNISIAMLILQLGQLCVVI